MADDNSPETQEIKETDIVFDCPLCGKSLAIDYRGAGLTIPCTDCGKSVVVPIPEGMLLADIDSNVEDQEGLILNLRKSLAAAEDRTRRLEADLEDMTAKRDALDKVRADNVFQFGSILERVSVLQQTQTDIIGVLNNIAEIAQQNKDQ
jgi:transcription elongation factor Elf1